MEQLLVETDAPYLTPATEKTRFRRNEPALIQSALFKLAEVKKVDPEYLHQRYGETPAGCLILKHEETFEKDLFTGG